MGNGNGSFAVAYMTERSLMESVARHLQVQALRNHKDGGDDDIFARSAYNRYYYATFLIVRSSLSSINHSWSSIAHKSYPDVLGLTIPKQLAKGRQKALSLNDMKLVTDCQSAIAAAKSLAAIMKSGSAVRVLADYEPEVKIDFQDEERFALGGVSITEAHQWPTRAKNLSAAIVATWKQINV